MHELQGSHTPKAKPFIVSINGLEKNIFILYSIYRFHYSIYGRK